MSLTKRQKALLDAKKKRERTGKTCPTPHKGSYGRQAALGVALRSSRRTGKPMRSYPCKCGSFHITKKTRNSK